MCFPTTPMLRSSIPLRSPRWPRTKRANSSITCAVPPAPSSSRSTASLLCTRSAAAVLLRVTYLELRAAPGPPDRHAGPESISVERPELSDYLSLYRRIGASLGWDQRLLMPEAELAQLLQSTQLRIY